MFPVDIMFAGRSLEIILTILLDLSVVVVGFVSTLEIVLTVLLWLTVVVVGIVGNVIVNAFIKVTMTMMNEDSDDE